MNEIAISQPLTSPDTPNPIDNLKEHVTQHVVQIGGKLMKNLPEIMFLKKILI